MFSVSYVFDEESYVFTFNESRGCIISGSDEIYNKLLLGLSGSRLTLSKAGVKEVVDIIVYTDATNISDLSSNTVLLVDCGKVLIEDEMFNCVSDDVNIIFLFKSIYQCDVNVDVNIDDYKRIEFKDGKYVTSDFFNLSYDIEDVDSDFIYSEEDYDVNKLLEFVEESVEEFQEIVVILNSNKFTKYLAYIMELCQEYYRTTLVLQFLNVECTMVYNYLDFLDWRESARISIV